MGRGRRELGRHGRAGAARRRGLVPPRRSRPGHPSVPHRPAAGRRASQRGDGRAGAPARHRGAPASRDRRPGADPGRRWPRRAHWAAPGTEVGFQDYFVRLHHDVAGARRCASTAPARHARRPGVLDAIGDAETIVVCPSNPIVSIGPCWPCPACARPWSPGGTDVVAVSPIVAGAALKGPADRLLAELGTEPSVVGVARLYAPWVGTLVIDDADAAHAAASRGRRAALRGGAHRHEHAGTGGRAGADGGRCRRLRACGVIPITGLGEVPRDDLAALIADALAGRPRRRPSSRPATWSWSPRRSSPRPRGAWSSSTTTTRGQGGTGATGVGAGAAPARRPAHHRDPARLRLRQRRRRPVQRGGRDGRPAARGLRPLGPPHPGRAASNASGSTSA